MPIMTGVRIRADLAMNIRRRVWKTEFAKMSDDTKEGLRQAVQRATVRMAMDARARAPVRTGSLKAAIKYIFFENPGGGLTGSVYVDRMVEPRTMTKMDIATRKEYGKRRPVKFPLMVEYGTYRSAERPFLIPALSQLYPYFEAECRRVVTKAYGD
jgi:hypothetical protein